MKTPTFSIPDFGEHFWSIVDQRAHRSWVLAQIKCLELKSAFFYVRNTYIVGQYGLVRDENQRDFYFLCFGNKF